MSKDNVVGLTGRDTVIAPLTALVPPYVWKTKSPEAILLLAKTSPPQPESMLHSHVDLALINIYTT